MDSIFHRVSIRSYKPQIVEESKITKMLQAAMAAPSAGNQQPWEFYVVTSRSILKQLSQCSPYASCVANAPMAIVPCSQSTAMFPENVVMDLSAATENLLLEADILGLGAVWLGIAPLKDRMEKVSAVLQIPSSLQPFAIVPVGYPAAVHPQENRFDPARIHSV